MQPNHIKTPTLQIFQIHISQRAIRIKMIKLGIERKQLANNINSMKDCISVILIKEESILGIHTKCIRIFSAKHKENYAEDEDFVIFAKYLHIFVTQ